MTLNFQLSEADFLTYQLYIASDSETIAKKRKRTRFMIPILYIVLAVYVWVASQNWIAALCMVGIAVLWWFFYPLYSAVRYRKHFDKFIRKNYKNRFNRDIEVCFTQDIITMKDSASHSSMNTTEVEKLVEIVECFFVTLNTGAAIIIPKHAVENPSVFKERLSGFGIPYQDSLGWKWK